MDFWSEDNVVYSLEMGDTLLKVREVVNEETGKPEYQWRVVSRYREDNGAHESLEVAKSHAYSVMKRFIATIKANQNGVRYGEDAGGIYFSWYFNVCAKTEKTPRGGYVVTFLDSKTKTSMGVVGFFYSLDKLWEFTEKCFKEIVFE